jgi:hypothetical protein
VCGVCHTIFMVAGRSYLIISEQKKGVPLKVSCALCQQEFFTPASLSSDKAGAEKYLADVFALHPCGKESTK